MTCVVLVLCFNASLYILSTEDNRTVNQLDDFMECLSKFTRYNSVRPLATLSYASDLYNGSSIVSRHVSFHIHYLCLLNRFVPGHFWFRKSCFLTMLIESFASMYLAVFKYILSQFFKLHILHVTIHFFWQVNYLHTSSALFNYIRISVGLPAVS